MSRKEGYIVPNPMRLAENLALSRRAKELGMVYDSSRESTISYNVKNAMTYDGYDADYYENN